MNFLFTSNGLSIGRDNGDKPIRKESTVIYRALLDLNAGNHTRHRWARCYPYRHGLTGCRIGMRHTKTGEIYWHGNYQIEAAHEAWNAGGLFLNKA